MDRIEDFVYCDGYCDALPKGQPLAEPAWEEPADKAWLNRVHTQSDLIGVPYRWGNEELGPALTRTLFREGEVLVNPSLPIGRWATLVPIAMLHIRSTLANPKHRQHRIYHAAFRAAGWDGTDIFSGRSYLTTEVLVSTLAAEYILGQVFQKRHEVTKYFSDVASFFKVKYTRAPDRQEIGTSIGYPVWIALGDDRFTNALRRTVLDSKGNSSRPTDVPQPYATARQEVQNELFDRLFPGGTRELQFKSKTVYELSNGKLSLEEATRLCGSLKTRIFFETTAFNGRTKLGPNAERLIQNAKESTNNKLGTVESAGIIFYLLFSKVDPGLDTLSTLRQFLESMFGRDDYGYDTDEIPVGLGEFGYEATNPIPVRGIASNSIYLEGLRTPDGRPVEHTRLRSVKVPNLSESIDEYRILQDGKELCLLYICPYNKRISTRPPRGFLLVQKD